MNKEVKKCIKTIIYDLLFIGIISWFWWCGPRDYLVYATANLNKINYSSNIKLTSNDKLDYNNSEYHFTIKNTSKRDLDYTIVISNEFIKSNQKNCKILSNNYLKYHIKDSEKQSIDRNLTLNGIIYKGSIKSNEKQDFSLNLWLDIGEKSLDKNTCFYPTIGVEQTNN